MTEQYNLYPLHVFRIVARLGSVTRAARELCISQPAVSSQLKTLQSRYKETLLERTPRGMLLTPAGVVVAEQANRVFAFLGDITAAVEATRGEVKGNITLAASSTPGAYLVPRLLRRFQDRYPDAKATLIVGDSSEVLSWLREYRVALGVVGETEMTEDFVREEAGRDELRLVAACGSGLTRLKEVEGKHLTGRTLFLREQGSSTRAGAEALLCGWLHHFGQIAELRETEAIKQSVAAGLGVAVLSSWATALEEKAGLLAPVQDTRLRRERRFYLARRGDRPLTGTADALWRCLTMDSV